MILIVKLIDKICKSYNKNTNYTYSNHSEYFLITVSVIISI